jgi:multidrug efflux pump subunit AcrA (membrane-fusion protein)
MYAKKEKKMKPKTIRRAKAIKVGSAIIILLAGAGMMQLLGNSKAESKKRAEKPEFRLVETMIPYAETIKLQVEANGTIESKEQITLVSQVSGKLVYAKGNLKSGLFVEKDELILQLDTREAENALYLHRANLINAIVKMIPEFLSDDVQVYQKWNNYLSSLSIEKATPELPQPESDREKIKVSLHQVFNQYYAVKNAELHLEYHSIRAPFSGTIHGEGISAGTIIPAGKNLAILEDAVHLEIKVPLTLNQITMLDPENNGEVSIHSEGNSTPLQGKIVRQERRLESQSQSLFLHIALENPTLEPAFLPGNYVSLQISGRELTNVCRIPRHLLQEENQVYTYQNAALHKTEVQVMGFLGNEALILNQLPQEAELITSILQKPIPGMPLAKIDHSQSAESNDLMAALAK